MKQYTRAIVVRRNGSDHVHQYPVFHYETIQEAVQAHGESFVLHTLNRAFGDRARESERAALIHDLRNHDA